MPHTMPPPAGWSLLPEHAGASDTGASFPMGPARADAGGGPWAMLNKNAERGRPKYVAANALALEDPVNVRCCFERGRQRLHAIDSQTKLAAPKYNGCSARGYVMLAHIPRDTNPEQVVWVLAWHTLKRVLPPMLLLPCADFAYCPDASVDRSTRRDGDVEHTFFTAREHREAALAAARAECAQAEALLRTLLAVTREPHDPRAPEATMRRLQRYVFVGELVARGHEPGKPALQEAARFVARFGVHEFHPSRYRRGELHPFLRRGAPSRSYCVEKSPALHAWVRVSPETLPQAAPQAAGGAIGICPYVPFGACPALARAARASGAADDAGAAGSAAGSAAIALDPAGLARRHYEFGTVLRLEDAAGTVFLRATAFDVLLRFTNIMGTARRPRDPRNERNRIKNVPTWGAALAAWRREEPSAQRGLPLVVLLGALPVAPRAAEDCGPEPVAAFFAKPQALRVLIARGPSGAHADAAAFAADAFAVVTDADSTACVAPARWLPVDEARWTAFVRALPALAEGCVLYLREAGELVKCKRTSSVLRMDCRSSLVTHLSARDLRITFVHEGETVNKRVVCHARPSAGLVPPDGRTWIPCASEDMARPLLREPALLAALARALRRAERTAARGAAPARLVVPAAAGPAAPYAAGLRAELAAATGVLHYTPEPTCRLQDDLFYYAVHRFLRPTGCCARDLEYVIACGPHALFGDIAARFPPAALGALAGAPFARALAAPRAPARAPPAPPALDPLLVWRAAPRAYARPPPAKRARGVRDEYGEIQHGESAVELLSDSSSDEEPAGGASVSAARVARGPKGALPAAPSYVVISSSEAPSEHSELSAEDDPEDAPAARWVRRVHGR